MFKVDGGTTSVANVRSGQVFDVLIDRTTPWRNPFSTNKFEREIAIDNYRILLLIQKPELVNNLYKLKGKILGCHCKPKACHGDVLAFLADWWCGPEGAAIKGDSRIIPVTAVIRVLIEKEGISIGRVTEALTFEANHLLYPKIKPLSFPLTRHQLRKMEGLLGKTERQWMELDMQYWLKIAELQTTKGKSLIIN